jgi:hypothetical protein
VGFCCLVVKINWLRLLWLVPQLKLKCRLYGCFSGQAYFNNADCMEALVFPQLKLLQYMNVLLKIKKQKKSMVFIIFCLWGQKILIIIIPN